MSRILSLDEGYLALRTGANRAGEGVTAAEVPRDFLMVTGDEAESYLQGQLSQDLSTLTSMTSTWSLLLEPTGKLGSWIRVTRHARPGAFLVDVDRGQGAAVAARLARFKLRAAVEIEGEAMDSWRCWAVDRSAGACPPPPFEGSDDFPQPWPGAAGWDHLCKRDDPPRPDVVIPIEAYEAVRIEAGVPKMGAELVADVIPAELGQWLIGASVSFTKGCYTGQELVARIDSRGGNVPRHLRGLVVDGPASVAPDELVGAEVVMDGDVVGSVTSAARSPGVEPGLGTVVALGFVARKVAPPAEAQLRTGAGATWPAQIRALPLVGAEPG